jgi:2-polyprenyl-3-methyl-5-hydroxy-6-metoxy-1,4-benzoquinol methylase
VNYEFRGRHVMPKTKEELLKEARAEAEYFDKEYSEDDQKQRLNNYIVPEKFIQQVKNPDPRPLKEFDYAYSLLGRLDGKKLLDYGAGDGWNTICFAKAKARVVAMDISRSGIELIKKKAEANGVSALVTAEVQNCYETSYPESTFDTIYGGGILHHLDVDAAGRELKRILKSDGVAVFFEPIRDTKIMDFIKAIVLFLIRRKPAEETQNESPMTTERIQSLNRYFRIVRYRYFNVLTSITLVIKSEILKSVLTRADYFLITYFPGFKKLARAVVIELREPVKAIK